MRIEFLNFKSLEVSRELVNFIEILKDFSVETDHTNTMCYTTKDNKYKLLLQKSRKFDNLILVKIEKVGDDNGY